MPEMGMSMRQAQRLVQRLEIKQLLAVEAPPGAVRGFAGLRIADQILRVHHTAGLIIGGVARLAWTGSCRGMICTRKDVDVAVLSLDSANHPDRFEGGIDWWATEDQSVGPINGNGVELIYGVWVTNPLAPGLYLAPAELLWSWRVQELAVFHEQRVVREVRAPRLRDKPLIHEYPTLPAYALEWRFTDPKRWRIFG